MTTRLAATFRCKACGAEAETVEFLPRYDKANVCYGSDAIVLHFSATTMAISDEQSVKLRCALEASDAAALYSAHHGWLATYCPVCNVCYCKTHWKIDQHPDPDSDGYSMHYDTYGTCPAGHRRLMERDSLAWPADE